jgi:hypothetical protein
MMGSPQRLYAFMRNWPTAYGTNSSVQDNVIGTRESQKVEPDYLKNSFQKAIVNSFAFETIQGREEAIPKAFERTCSWILQREPGELDGKRLWPSFPDWLENCTDQPYWITGKPGSGKST